MHEHGRKIPDGTVIECDVCIVGAGVAGAVLAHELGKTGTDVVLIEAGGLRGEAGSQKLYRGESDNPEFHLPPDQDRTRGLGGSSAMWGGRCMPLDPIDFEPRDHIPQSGWPFGAEELARWYPAAQRYADCGAYAYDAAAAGLQGELIAGFENSVLLTSTLERWSPPTHFGKLLRDELLAARNIRLITGAVATELLRGSGPARVTGVVVQSIKGKRRFRVNAARVVLAGGGLETTRLLLTTAADGQPAIGDHSGWLGRGYMCHVQGVISRIALREGQEVLFGYEQDPDGIYVRRRFTFSADAQRQHRLPNLYALLDRPLPSDASHNSAILSLTYLAKRLFQRQSREPVSGGLFALYMRHIRNLVFGAPEVLTVLPRFGRDRFLKGRRLPSLLLSAKDNVFYLYFHAEQSPDRESRVTLGHGRDGLGMPQLRIEARITEADVEGIIRAHQLIGEELHRAGVGRLEFTGDDPAALVRNCKCTLGHHIGTARMAADPANGVTDADLRVHGTENLYIASTAAFPTSSQAHPTLTLLALTLRLADHLIACGRSATEAPSGLPGKTLQHGSPLG